MSTIYTEEYLQRCIDVAKEEDPEDWEDTITDFVDDKLPEHDLSESEMTVLYAHYKHTVYIYSSQPCIMGCHRITNYSQTITGCVQCWKQPNLVHNCPKTHTTYSYCNITYSSSSRCECRDRKGYTYVFDTLKLLTQPVLDQCKPHGVLCMDWLPVPDDEHIIFEDLAYPIDYKSNDHMYYKNIQSLLIAPGGIPLWYANHLNAKYDLSLSKINEGRYAGLPAYIAYC